MTDEQIGIYNSERLRLILSQAPDYDPDSPMTSGMFATLLDVALEDAMSPKYPGVELQYLPAVFQWLRKEEESGTALIAGIPAEEYAKKIGAAIFSPLSDANSPQNDTSTKQPIGSKRSRSRERLDVVGEVVPTELIVSLQLSHDHMPEGFKKNIRGFSDISTIVGDLLDRRMIEEMTAVRLVAVTGVQRPYIRNTLLNNNLFLQESIAKTRNEISGIVHTKNTESMKYPSEWQNGSTLFIRYLDYAAHTKNPTLVSYMQTIMNSFYDHKMEPDPQYFLACIGYALAASYKPT